MKKHQLTFLIAFLMLGLHLCATPNRENFDKNWSFALGHASEPAKDFNHNTSYFSYLSKTGFGDGPASQHFDDRGWRKLDVPHDWAVEMPFDEKASHSHGYKAVGPGFPENSVGWYRKHFFIPESDLGQRIRIDFDGVYRDADVFVNGFWVGNEPSGYLGHSYDLSDYLNYGASNVLVVRVDASKEEGWFYEGAGIYRHVWLNKTTPQYFVKDGVWVNPTLKKDGNAEVFVEAEISNQANALSAGILTLEVVDAEGKSIASKITNLIHLKAGEVLVSKHSIAIDHPILWDIDRPYLYELSITLLNEAEQEIDSWRSPFGVRTVEWDPNKGFFLNGRHVKLKGTNNHQDHAGVGAAIPDSLQIWRLKQLKHMGSNVYRASHNPPTPELLDVCDRMGMLVIDETRLMGINPYHFSQLERLVRRDRNHPSVILWSLGNEEWGIEGNVKGARITKTMQDFCHRLDPTRYTTVAISGGWGGVSHTVQCAGVNYIGQADPDQQHKDYPEQIILGTEETTTQQTRGIYVRDDERCHLPPLDDGSTGGNLETGWKFYAEREYTAGVVYWTGFDYRGEPTPFPYPGIASQFGILDTCGFPKDGYYYLTSWWTDEPVLHLFPHWNWSGREGESIDVRVHSNCEAAELFLNGESLGMKQMELYGHLQWDVPYQAGELEVRAKWVDGTERSKKISTTGDPKMISLNPDRVEMPAAKGEVAVVTVAVLDSKENLHPTAECLIEFELSGPGKIIGVGNGNPSSFEPDVYVENVWTEAIGEWTAPNPADTESLVVFETDFDVPMSSDRSEGVLYFNDLGVDQSVSINGKSIDLAEVNHQLRLDSYPFKPKGNHVRMEAKPYAEWGDREGLFQKRPAYLRFEQPAEPWKRRVFNGLAQVIVESTEVAGKIELIARSHDRALLDDSIVIHTK